MTEIFDFIVTNYAWILVIVLIILLSIIGSFAEKSLFDSSSKPSKTKDEDKTIDLSNKKMSDFFGGGDNTQNQINNENNIQLQPVNVDTTNQNVNSFTDNTVNNVISSTASNEVSNNQVLANTGSVDNNTEIKSKTNTELMTTLESKLSSLDKQINDVLPKKELINNDMLDELDEMSIETDKKKSTKKDDLKLSDIKLPNIKSSKSKKKDLWK